MVFFDHLVSTNLYIALIFRLTRINEETDMLVTLPKILIRRAGETSKEEESIVIPDLQETVKLLTERERKKQAALLVSDSHTSTGAPSPPAGVSIEIGLGPSWKMTKVGHVLFPIPFPVYKMVPLTENC